MLSVLSRRNRNLVSLAVAATFALLVYTGLRLYLFPHSPGTAALHTLFAVVFSAIIAAHVVNNARPLLSYAIGRRRRRPTRELLGVLLAVAAVWIAFDADVWVCKRSIDSAPGIARSSRARRSETTAGRRSWLRKRSEAASSSRFAVKKAQHSAIRFSRCGWSVKTVASFAPSIYPRPSPRVGSSTARKLAMTGHPVSCAGRRRCPCGRIATGTSTTMVGTCRRRTTPRLDAVSGATPTDKFEIHTSAPMPKGGEFDLYFEVNQSYDWNYVFSKTAFPNDAEYHTGQNGQPSLVYWTRVYPRHPRPTTCSRLSATGTRAARAETSFAISSRSRRPPRSFRCRSW